MARKAIQWLLCHVIDAHRYRSVNGEAMHFRCAECGHEVIDDWVW